MSSGWSVLTVLLGLALIVVPIMAGARALGRRRTWVSATAVVTSVKERRDDHGARERWAAYTYTDGSGQRHGGVTATTSRPPKRKSELPIRYHPEHPEISETAGRVEDNLLLGVLLLPVAAGVGAVVLGLQGAGLL